jgi:hypothetical protein
MRSPIEDDKEIIVKFTSMREHEAFCQQYGCGSRFIYRRLDSGHVHVLCRLDRRINRFGEWIDDPMFVNPNTGKPCKSARITPLERSLLEQR